MKRFLLVMLIFNVYVEAKTPKLNITLEHNSTGEQKRKEQIERLAEQYDLRNTRSPATSSSISRPSITRRPC